MNMNHLKGILVAVELKTGEKLIGYIINEFPQGVLPNIMAMKLNDGIFLRRQKVVSYLAYETISKVRVAKPGERESD